MDINELWIVGTVEKYDRPDTRTGKPMARLIVRCGKERVAVVAFDDLARLVFRIGDRIDVVGRIESTNYTANNGLRRHGYQLVAEALSPI